MTPPTPGFEQQIAHLASLWGVKTGYRQPSGELSMASTNAIVKVLQALGARVSGPKDVDEAITARETELANVGVLGAPVIWLAGSGPPDENSVPLNTWSIPLHSSWEGQAVEVKVTDSAGVARKARGKVEHGQLPMPFPLPIGVHKLELQRNSSTTNTHLFVAPERTWKPSPTVQRDGAGQGATEWGVFVPHHALTENRDHGGGDLSTLSRLGTWAAEYGSTLLGTLPLLESFVLGDDDGVPLDGLFEPSPYAPISRCFWAPHLLSFDAAFLPEKDDSAHARELIQSQEHQQTSKRLREAPLQDPAGLAHHKAKVIRALSDAAWRSDLSTEINNWANQEPTRAQYAVFRARIDQTKRSWRQWNDQEMKLELDPENYDAETQLHLYQQWALHRQMKTLSAHLGEAGSALYLDLPIGVHPDGFDAFRFRHLYVEGVAVGAPPDPVFVSGQNWGFSPTHPDKSAKNGFPDLMEALRAQMQIAGKLRIDHILGFFRSYWIPAGLGARQGVYVGQPTDALFAALSIQSHKYHCEVIGEDLGVVPDNVRARMRRHGVTGMYVGQYAIGDPSTAFHCAPEGSLASLNTHDTPTFAGYIAGDDIKDRQELGWLGRDDADQEGACRQSVVQQLSQQLHQRHPNATTLAAAAYCELQRHPISTLMVNLEDLWAERRPHNVPGTHRERPNWLRRSNKTLDTIMGDEAVQSQLRAINNSRKTPERRTNTRIQRTLTANEKRGFPSGSWIRQHQKLGAFACRHGGKAGFRFTVWAPFVQSVRVVGDFNHWSGNDAELQPVDSTGLWTGFVAGVKAGQCYKYRVVGVDGTAVDKADPFARRSERPPKTASVTWQSRYRWNDDAWMMNRNRPHAHTSPMSIYEVHLGSWRRPNQPHTPWLNYREMAPLLVAHVRALNFTHVELMPVAEHPFYGSWGYQVTGYFAPTARYGTPDDFAALIDALHQAGIGVILDWVPAHFPDDLHGLARFNGEPLYEHPDPQRGHHPDWDTSIFDYGRPEVQSFLISNALYWLEEFHIDGLRVDAVASMLYLDYSRGPGAWTPNVHGGREHLEAVDFIRRFTDTVHREVDGAVVIAEESTAWSGVTAPTQHGGLGFDFKWDLGWMHDTLSYFSEDPVHRRHHHDRITFRAMYQQSEKFMMPLSHDEVVHGKGSILGKMPGDRWQKYANLRLLLGLQWASPGKKLIFMGTEYGVETEWNHDSSLPWAQTESSHPAGLARFLAEINRLYTQSAPLFSGDHRDDGFQWISGDDRDQSVITFMRISPGGMHVAVVCNFTPVPRPQYQVGVPVGGIWKLIVNSDDIQWGGSGYPTQSKVLAEPPGFHGHAQSLCMDIPPLSVMWFIAEVF